jgi:hypothetical protein
MSGEFDPYYTWLAIPPDEQPPHHYRLLGVPCFEANADVIAIAADRQMLHLRTYQSGKNGLLSQRLLNEVATAKLCLLNPPKKAAYDEQLRQRLAAEAPRMPPPVAPPIEPPEAPPIESLLAPPMESPLAPPIEPPAAEPMEMLAPAAFKPASRASRGPNRWVWVAGMLAIAAGIVVAAKWGPLAERKSLEAGTRSGTPADESAKKTDVAKRNDATKKTEPAKKTDAPKKTDVPKKTDASPQKTAAPQKTVELEPLVPYKPDEPAKPVEKPIEKPAEKPTPRAAPAGGTLRVQYKCGDSGREANQIRFTVQILNDGPAAVPLGELTLRYWYTADGDRPQQYWCDYAKVDSKNVSAAFHKLGRPTSTADCCLEITFAAGAGSIPPGESSGDIQNRAAHDDWTPYTFANDYSHDGTKTAFTDWPRITLYRNGKLVWGAEPGAK